MAKKSINLTQTDINKAVYIDREYYIRDTDVRQLFYRVKKGNKFSWVVRYTDPETGKERRKFTLDVPTNRLEDARKAAEKFFSDLIAGENPDQKKKTLALKSLTLSEAVELYKPYTNDLKSGEGVMQELYKICKWQNIGKSPINKIKRQDLNKFIEDEINIGNTRRTINKKITLLYGMMNALYENGDVKREDVELPLKPKKLPETDSSKNRRYFEPDERIRLVQTAKRMPPAWLYTAIIVSLNTGLRPGSLFNLKWTDLDFRTSTIQLQAGYMKTKDHWIIPMNKKTSRALKEWRKKIPPTQEIIFKGAKEAVTKQEWTDAFNALTKEAGIKGMTWYNTRHDFASQLIMKGVSLYTVKDLMCHKNITTTQVYAHLSPDLKSAAVALLDTL